MWILAARAQFARAAQLGDDGIAALPGRLLSRPAKAVDNEATLALLTFSPTRRPHSEIEALS